MRWARKNENAPAERFHFKPFRINYLLVRISYFTEKSPLVPLLQNSRPARLR
jgi:hypothetical protein